MPSFTTHEVTSELSVKLVDLPKQKNFPKCAYCGNANFWDETWPSAWVLSKYLAEEFPSGRFDGCHALVIGCGMGLEGLVLAKLGANVSFLDHIPEALQIVSKNCLLNEIEIEPSQTICYCWKDSMNLPSIGTYDLIIGSDILNYYVRIGEWVWIESLLKASLKKKGMGLFSDPMRYDDNRFSSILYNGGFVVERHNPGSSKDQILSLRRRF